MAVCFGLRALTLSAEVRGVLSSTSAAMQDGNALLRSWVTMVMYMQGRLFILLQVAYNLSSSYTCTFILHLSYIPRGVYQPQYSSRCLGSSEGTGSLINIQGMVGQGRY